MEPLEPRLFFFFFESPHKAHPTMAPEPRFLRVSRPFLRNRASFGPADGINRRGFLSRVRPYPTRRRATCRRRYLLILLYPGRGGDSPAGLGGNDVIRRLPHVGRRRRGRHSTGVLFARPPIPHSTMSNAPFSRYSNFSHPNGGGIQQQLREEEEEDVTNVTDGGRRNAWQWSSYFYVLHSLQMPDFTKGKRGQGNAPGTKRAGIRRLRAYISRGHHWNHPIPSSRCLL